jgi:lipopolysaccharide export system protein LptC
VVSNRPVEVLMLDGVLKAKRVELIEHGAIARFDGGVTMTLRPSGAATTGQIGGEGTQ